MSASLAATVTAINAHDGEFMDTRVRSNNGAVTKTDEPRLRHAAKALSCCCIAVNCDAKSCPTNLCMFRCPQNCNSQAAIDVGECVSNARVLVLAVYGCVQSCWGARWVEL